MNNKVLLNLVVLSSVYLGVVATATVMSVKTHIQESKKRKQMKTWLKMFHDMKASEQYVNGTAAVRKEMIDSYVDNTVLKQEGS